MMKRVLLSTCLLAALAGGPATLAHADSDDGGNRLTIAVFGDWPYNQNLLDNAPRLVNSVNSDKAVSTVIHVGDIHSGSAACTSAGILPPIPTSVPGWNQQIFYWFQQFKAPLVYTPGDNDWTDCQKSKEFAAGDPLKELAAERSLFFSEPGQTLGLKRRDVTSQAKAFNPAFPADAQYVENVFWTESRVVFVTINMPGSNNDTLPWAGIFANPAAQSAEVAARTAADIRWLQQAFRQARDTNAKAVVIAQQADMWDPAQLVTGGDGLSAYKPYVQALATEAIKFGKPVLLLNGDSHLFLADHPLANPTSATGQIHNTPPVSNLTRIVVQGSTNAPAEWLRLTIDPNSRNVFTYQNVSYCKDPNSSCQ